MARTPSQPPQLEGYRFLQPLGTGGFSDVFLYEQLLPNRTVAVSYTHLTLPTNREV